ncbi:MAG: hypothetical protein ACI8XB_002003 [Patiriisocius sp.]|jgi:hypothetical protein
MSVVRIRVLLDDSQIEAYRDIDIAMDDHFETLHYKIIECFGLKGDQMASFYQSDNDWNKGEEIPLMNMEEDAMSMRDFIIKSKAGKKGDRFFYIYDFLTMWIFYVEVMEEKKVEKDVSYPIVSEVHGPMIDEDSRNENSEMPEMEGVSSGKPKRPAIEEEYLDNYGLDDGEGDPLEGEFEDIDDYDF